MKQVKDIKEETPEQWPELRELVDAAAMIAIFKNEAEDKLTAQVPLKAIESLESAIRRFHPKVWEYVETERTTYLKYVQNKSKNVGDLDTKDLNSSPSKKVGLSRIWSLLGKKG